MQEMDNGGASEWRHGGNRSDLSEFSDIESDRKGKKEKNILGAKKKDKDKKKEKESRYATLGDESSGDEDGKKKSKKKGFQFGSAKKEKKEKKEKEAKDVKDARKKEKKEKEKDKSKLKIKKPKVEGDVEGKGEDSLVFGVPLELATSRSKCHDGIKLPVLVRECIDFIEENCLKVEGIYRSSGVKSKVSKLKSAYNTRQTVSLTDSEPAVVASLLKLFLRELPDPILTNQLVPKFEELCNKKDVSKIQAELKSLLQQLPECNRTLVEWIFVHMGHVISNEKYNKMSLQNVSIVLSPTMQISHRILYCFFKHSNHLFDHVKIKKYIPPISGQGGLSLLPESPEGIEEEMKKQESLLEDLHKDISRGVASKATEEQLWEQQRIVTQLKRKLRQAKSSQRSEDNNKYDHEEELNFSLQTPLTPKQPSPTKQENVAEVTEKIATNLSSPDEKGEANGGQEHRVTVQIHQADQTVDGHVTVIQLDKNISNNNKSSAEITKQNESGEKVSQKDLNNHIQTDKSPKKEVPVKPETESTPKSTDEKDDKPSLETESSCDNEIKLKKVEFVEKKEDINPPNMTASNISKMNIDDCEKPASKAGIPFLPPPPSSSKPSSRGLLKPTIIAPQEVKLKSKSLPRGMPSDSFKAITSEHQPEHKAVERVQLLQEEMRLKLEYEELLNLKGELERRRKTERREISELQEEIATMQTLYQYRTYSVDSSEESNDEQEENKQAQADKRQLVRQMARTQSELEQKKAFLLNKLEEERTACLQLRVQIRIEQDRIKRKAV